MKKIRVLAILVVAYLMMQISAFAQTSLIKYKDYIIPISSCEQYDAAKANIYYFNDGGYPNEDPDWTQDTLTILGMDNFVNLLGFGWYSPSWVTDESAAENVALVQQVVDVTGRNFNVLYGEQLVDDIIKKAKLVNSCSNGSKKLVVGMGGPFTPLARAITKAPEIASMIRVNAFEQTNRERDEAAYQTIINAVGNSNYRVIGDGTLYTPDNTNDSLWALYNNYISPVLGKVRDQYGIALNDPESFYLKEALRLNDAQYGQKHPIKMCGDCRTLIIEIWGNNINSPTFMYDKIQNALSRVQ